MDKKRFCCHCSEPYEATTAWQKYCTRVCHARAERKRNGLVRDKGRFCKQCGIHFFPPSDSGNKLHCSDECALKSARQSRCKFWDKSDRKEKSKKYYRNRIDKVGKDGNLKRFYHRHPDAPRVCQSCGEDRVLDVAHKPGHERNGAWRSAKNTTPDKVWILCPTCHALLDRMNYSPSDLNLIK